MDARTPAALAAGLALCLLQPARALVRVAETPVSRGSSVNAGQGANAALTTALPSLDAQALDLSAQTLPGNGQQAVSLAGSESGVQPLETLLPVQADPQLELVSPPSEPGAPKTVPTAGSSRGIAKSALSEEGSRQAAPEETGNTATAALRGLGPAPDAGKLDHAFDLSEGKSEGGETPASRGGSGFLGAAAAFLLALAPASLLARDPDAPSAGSVPSPAVYHAENAAPAAHAAAASAPAAFSWSAYLPLPILAYEALRLRYARPVAKPAESLGRRLGVYAEAAVMLVGSLALFGWISSLVSMAAGIGLFPFLLAAIARVAGSAGIEAIGKDRRVIVGGWQASHDQRYRIGGDGQLRDVRGHKYGEDRYEEWQNGPVTPWERFAVRAAAALLASAWVAA
ncbi:MAG TPA: hypothetical protein VNI01_10780, partial [Elusimicrobiota bacterium]|nr:hypothetical protein [Elusimicrobiota bacterium]